MTKTKDLIIKLKRVKEERGLSLTDIANIMEEKGHYPLAKSTLSRVFSDGSEELSFKYEETIRPIADALLDLETIEPEDDANVQAIKTILKYKIERIEELEAQLNQERIAYLEKLNEQRDAFDKNTELLRTQVILKDQRIDYLFNAVQVKDVKIYELLERMLDCPARNSKLIEV